VTVLEAISRAHGHAHGITDLLVKPLNAQAPNIAIPKLSGREGADTAATMKAEAVFQEHLSIPRRTTPIVGYGDLVATAYWPDDMDCFMFCVAISSVLTIWQAAVVDEA
jgi:hypothetical protein